MSCNLYQLLLPTSFNLTKSLSYTGIHVNGMQGLRWFFTLWIRTVGNLQDSGSWTEIRPTQKQMKAGLSAIVSLAVHAACLLWPSSRGSSLKAGVALNQATSTAAVEGLVVDLAQLGAEGLDVPEAAIWKEGQSHGSLHRKLLLSGGRPRCDAHH